MVGFRPLQVRTQMIKRTWCLCGVGSVFFVRFDFCVDFFWFDFGGVFGLIFWFVFGLIFGLIFDAYGIMDI